jgi:hypothetical protein
MSIHIPPLAYLSVDFTQPSPGPWTVSDGRGGYEIKDANGVVIGRFFGTVSMRMNPEDGSIKLPAKANAEAVIKAMTGPITGQWKGEE